MSKKSRNIPEKPDLGYRPYILLGLNSMSIASKYLRLYFVLDSFDVKITGIANFNGTPAHNDPVQVNRQNLAVATDIRGWPPSKIMMLQKCLGVLALHSSILFHYDVAYSQLIDDKLNIRLEFTESIN